MARNYRAIRFGYWIHEGLVVPQPIESKIVKWIYAMYLQGYSYQELADHLTVDGVVYQNEDSTWNKHLVKRILESESYCGDLKYPKIIEKIQWEQVQEIRQMRSAKRAVKTIWPKSFRQRLFCAQCGSRIYRGNQGKRENWQCQQEGKLTKGYMTDALLWEKLIEKQKQLMMEPEQLQVPEKQTPEVPIRVISLRNEIVKQIKLQEQTEEELLEMIYHAAAEQYKECDDLNNTYETEKIIRLYQEKQIGSEPDFELIEHTVRKILIDSRGDIYFEMINGKLV